MGFSDTSGVGSTGSVDDRLSRSASSVLPRRIMFLPAQKPDLHAEQLRRKYIPINSDAYGRTADAKASSKPGKSADSKESTKEIEDDNLFKKPRSELFSEAKIESMLRWSEVRKIGAGLTNLGNTCFLNAALQCLTYTPPLAMCAMQREHTKTCRRSDFCVFCTLERHVNTALGASGRSVSPKDIVRNLRSISKQLKPGRQEDAHEFLRFVIDHMQTSALGGLKPNQMEPRVAETTVVHRIFGGYLQSQVQCLACRYESNTFECFLDLSLEIKGCETVERALQHFCKVESLDHDNKYMCPMCRKKVKAHKQFTIMKAPNVMTVQLKRFSFSGYGAKTNKPVSYPDRLDIRPYMSQGKNSDGSGPTVYSLYGVLVHHGDSMRSGHYYSYVKSAAGIWYCMDDDSVRQVSAQEALTQRAYILFYVRNAPVPRPERPASAPAPGADPVVVVKAATPSANGKTEAKPPQQANKGPKMLDVDGPKKRPVAAPQVLDVGASKKPASTAAATAAVAAPLAKDTKLADQSAGAVASKKRTRDDQQQSPTQTRDAILAEVAAQMRRVVDAAEAVVTPGRRPADSTAAADAATPKRPAAAPETAVAALRIPTPTWKVFSKRSLFWRLVDRVRRLASASEPSPEPDRKRPRTAVDESLLTANGDAHPDALKTQRTPNKLNGDSTRQKMSVSKQDRQNGHFAAEAHGGPVANGTPRSGAGKRKASASLLANGFGGDHGPADARDSADARVSADSSSKKAKHAANGEATANGASDPNAALKPSAPRTARGGVSVTNWDSAPDQDYGYRDEAPEKPAIVDELFALGNKRSAYGVNVPMWDATDDADRLEQLARRRKLAATLESVDREDEHDRRELDDWNEELDRGRLKKVKVKRPFLETTHNPFQHATQPTHGPKQAAGFKKKSKPSGPVELDD
eukprot:TRINITY_DN31453_c0_g1_i1.p1 TRINITY_DN31453_c0_g1~~TRINITY_DN31453_c0_g1_i1.p1  ORF type:complete len:920 (+),score=284.56 TRINITY_DN31453_c0_g1_i1:25-2784(+)